MVKPLVWPASRLPARENTSAPRPLGSGPSYSTPIPLQASRRFSSKTVGLVYGIGSNGLGGLLPLYLITLAPAGPVEIVADRVVFTLLTLLVIIATNRSWGRLSGVFRSRGTLGALTLAALFFGVTWLIYMYGVTSGQAIDVSLGSFVAPLLNVLVGVLVLRERLRPLQWAAVGIGFIAVLVLAGVYGRVPWIAALYAIPWGLYGLVKNRIGAMVDALTSLTVETIILAPFALAAMGWLAASGTLTLTGYGAAHFGLLAIGGVLTAVPMLSFGAAARRLSMTTAGLLQYLNPLLMFVLAVTVLGEQMRPERWNGFAIVWLGLVLLALDSLVAARTRRAARPARRHRLSRASAALSMSRLASEACLKTSRQGSGHPGRPDAIAERTLPCPFPECR